MANGHRRAHDRRRRGVSGSEPLGFNRELFQALFPGLHEVFSPDDTAVLLASTRVVGMRCPGQWALFRQLTWEAPIDDPSRHDELAFRVSSVDRRFDLVKLELTDGERVLVAEVQLRRPPPAQPSLAVAKSLVRPGEFADVRALVVGGSRGLGEVASKLVIAGGGRVLLTFRSGKEDAETIARELGSRSSILRLDIDKATSTLPPEIKTFDPTHVLYFATPPISKRPPGSWDNETFERFANVYADGLSRLLELLESHAVNGLFVPSSTYMSTMPRPGSPSTSPPRSRVKPWPSRGRSGVRSDASLSRA